MNKSNDKIVVDDDEDEIAMEDAIIDIAAKDFCGFSSVEEFSKAGFQSIVEATKAANGIPTGASRDLYSSYPSFGRVLDIQSNRIINIISHVLKYQQIKGNIERRDNDEKFELLQECNDLILERVNSNLDVMSGIKKEPETVLIETALTPVQFKPASGSWNRKHFDRTSSIKSAKLLTAKNIMRPQTNFKIPVDNSNKNPFEPKLKYKPNSIKPLAILAEYDDEGNIESYLHPYEFELNKFQVSPLLLTEVIPTHPIEIEKTPFQYIDDEITLNQMVAELKDINEIGVDLEHHSYRTFQGITCLLQISTREKDYIVDTLTLREDLHILNEIFTKPSVVKIFHGADSDIEWLQRDLSLYVVNMFDTHQAAKQLGLARLSLAFLLKQYCKIELDKTFQLADWRIRPIPEELLAYARKDTHYLLYIYDCMKNDLLKQAHGQTNILESVFQKSTDICKKRYIKPRLTNDSFMELYRKSKKNFDNRQLYALKHLFLWRDKIAREEDESYFYVLPHHMMLQIAETLPREMQGILACCNPIPPLIRQNLNPLHQIILKARDQSLVKAITEDIAVVNRIHLNMRDINNLLYCPHDLSTNTDFRDDLPTLLGEKKEVSLSKFINLATPALNIFESIETSEDDVSAKMAKLKKISFVSPYRRYTLILPYAEQQRLEELKKEKEIAQRKKLCPDSKEDKLKENSNTPKDKPVKTQNRTLNQIKNKRAHDVDVNELHKEVETDEIINKKPKIESINNSDSDSDGDSVEILESPNPVEIIIEDDKDSEAIEVKRNQRKKNKKQKYVTQKATKQKSNEAVAFDYSKVDFKRFQGGSHNNKNTSNAKSIFHGKSKNKKEMKKFNQMFSFSTINKRGGKK